MRAVCFILGMIIVGGLVYYFFPEKALKVSKGEKINKILVLKKERKLILLANGKKIKTYSIALGRNPVGDKEYEGDKKTPEGIYQISAKIPAFDFHKALLISYPDEKDRAYSRKIDRPPGGEILIHGLRNEFGFIGKFHRLADWTEGCMAVTNAEMDEIYDHIEKGTEIEIRR